MNAGGAERSLPPRTACGPGWVPENREVRLLRRLERPGVRHPWPVEDPDPLAEGRRRAEAGGGAGPADRLSQRLTRSYSRVLRFSNEVIIAIAAVDGATSSLKNGVAMNR